MQESHSPKPSRPAGPRPASSKRRSKMKNSGIILLIVGLLAFLGCGGLAFSLHLERSELKDFEAQEERYLARVTQGASDIATMGDDSPSQFELGLEYYFRNDAGDAVKRTQVIVVSADQASASRLVLREQLEKGQPPFIYIKLHDDYPERVLLAEGLGRPIERLKTGLMILSGVALLGFLIALGGMLQLVKAKRMGKVSLGRVAANSGGESEA